MRGSKGSGFVLAFPPPHPLPPSHGGGSFLLFHEEADCVEAFTQGWGFLGRSALQRALQVIDEFIEGVLQLFGGAFEGAVVDRRAEGLRRLPIP